MHWLTAARIREARRLLEATDLPVEVIADRCGLGTGRRVRMSVIEPGTVDTELASHLRDDIREAARSQTASIEPLRPEDIADTVAYIVTRDRRVAVNEMLVRAGEQTW